MAEIFGVEVPDLPESVVAMDVVMSIKVMLANGNVGLIERASTGINNWEALGAAITLADTLRDGMRGGGCGCGGHSA